MALNDGLASGELRVGSLWHTIASGGEVVTTTLTAGASEIGNAEIANNAASGTKVTLEYPLLYGGSPIIGNWSAIMGTGTANTYTVFAKSFAAAPAPPLGYIGVQASASGLGQMVFPTNISTGSFLPSGGAAVAVLYLAVGSGRI